VKHDIITALWIRSPDILPVVDYQNHDIPDKNMANGQWTMANGDRNQTLRSTMVASMDNSRATFNEDKRRWNNKQKETK
jgi:hypothetical protein